MRGGGSLPNSPENASPALKAENVGPEVARIAEEHNILNRLLFIGRTISEPKVRAALRQSSPKARTAAVANNSEEFPQALAATDADWVYVRFLPTTEQINAVHLAKKKAFIAGPTVSDELPKNWQQAATAGIDGILTDYPLKLRAVLKQQTMKD
jgi:glycerophosphoryl diester phosphodiesterase